MKRLSLVMILSALTFHNASSQTYIGRNFWQPFISVQYGSMNFGDVGTMYHHILQTYRDEGVPVQIQTDFGRTVELGGGALYSPIQSMWLGVSVTYSYSPAFSDYRDFAGTLRINGSVRSTQLVFMGGYTLARVAGCPIRAFVKPGYSSFSAVITENLQIPSSAGTIYSRSRSTSTGGPYLEMTVGAWIPVGPLQLSVELGYRGVFIGQSAYSLETVPADPATPNSQVYWNVADSGFMLTTSIGLPLY